MFKSKLNEFCQRKGLEVPLYETTGLPLLFSCNVSINCTNMPEIESGLLSFCSKESHTNKKKAESDAAEVALAFFLCGTTTNNTKNDTPTVESNLSKEDSDSADLISAVKKAANFSCRGLLNGQYGAPAEVLLLFPPVQSALKRIDSSFRKDAVGAYNYLLKSLASPLQTLLDLEIQSDRVLVRIKSPAEDKKYRKPFSDRTLKEDYSKAIDAKVIQYVIIPASKPAFEVQIDLNVRTEEIEKDEGKSDIDIEDGEKLLRAYSALFSGLNTTTNAAISTTSNSITNTTEMLNATISAPLYLPVKSGFQDSLSHLFYTGWNDIYSYLNLTHKLNCYINHSLKSNTNTSIYPYRDINLLLFSSFISWRLD